MPVNMILFIETIFLYTFIYVVSVLSKSEQIHISFGDDDTQMTIMWSTQDDIRGFVQYGQDPESLIHSEYSETSVLQSDNWNALKVIHRSKLKNLRQGKKYYYKVVCGTENSSSSVFSFKTQSKNRKRPVKFLVYGDMGTLDGRPTFAKLQEEVSKGDIDAVWHIGDIAYNLHSGGGKIGDQFLEQAETIATRVPYMTSPGNHELQDGFHHYRTRFSMPNTSWPMPKDKLWYSYDIGLVHFISYSTEAFFSDNEYYTCTQYKWLQDDLTKANKNRHLRPWIIAMGHRPMYCSNNDIDDCTGRIFSYWVKHGLEDLFYEQGVDLVLQAHEHSYERLWPVYNFEIFSKNYINPRAPVHIISGAAGSNEAMDPFGNPDPWSAFHASEKSSHSYGRLFVSNNTHLYFEQVLVKDGEILDSVWVKQEHHGQFVNISCTGSNKSKSCDCPKPIPYVVYGVLAGLVLLFLVVASIVLCCWIKKRKKKCACLKCKDKTKHYALVDHMDSDEDIIL